MKPSSLIPLIIFLLATAAFPQQFSAGLLMSRFSSSNNNARISSANNPLGTGVLLAYTLRQNAAVVFTTEFYGKSVSGTSQKEKAVRAHLSFTAVPVTYGRFGAYFSTGVVYARTTTETLGVDATDNSINLRLGAGADYRLTRSLSVNVDAGMYTDGWRYSGWSQSVGLRYGIGLF